ncbi:MAG: hypothetical protein NVSMB65_04810 [Chloroflexota bacterium]
MAPLRLYPDRMVLRLAYALADLAVLGWACMWAIVGRFVYNTIMALNVIADGITAAGQHLNLLILTLEQGARQNLPVVGDWLGSLVHQLGGSGTPLIGFGQSSLVAIHNLAVALTLVIAGPPLLAGLLTYVPWRWRRTREFASLHIVMRGVTPPLEDEALRILAGRALYSLPFHVLLHYSRNPIAEFAAGDYENLARAAMAQQGLHLDRYLALPDSSGGADVGVDPLDEIGRVSTLHHERPWWHRSCTGGQRAGAA